MIVSERSQYLELHASGELRERARRALGLLEGRCRACPRLCKVDRLADRPGLCRVGRHAVWRRTSRTSARRIAGRRGSGTIFFSGCNLRCMFCQNHDISWRLQGERVTPKRLAGMMLKLQAIGCHNINWVTPEHVVPQILEALPLAVDGGLRLPIVYNTSAYDSPESLALMDGVVDVYMPDFKLWSSELARRYLAKRDYPEVVRHSLREMHRQVGDPRARRARRGPPRAHRPPPRDARSARRDRGDPALRRRRARPQYVRERNGPVLARRAQRRVPRDRPAPLPVGVRPRSRAGPGPRTAPASAPGAAAGSSPGSPPPQAAGKRLMSAATTAKRPTWPSVSGSRS